MVGSINSQWLQPTGLVCTLAVLVTRPTAM